jgi:transcriptional regulator with XRE-family HTH domain
MSAKWFAGRLRELRLAAGLSQRELAERAGIDKDSLSRLERDLWQPTWETVLALCQALGVDCTAFTMQPAEHAKPRGRGRPRKGEGGQAGAGLSGQKKGRNGKGNR